MRSQTPATEARPDPHPALLGELLLAFAGLPISEGSFGAPRSQGLAAALASEVFLPHCEQRIRRASHGADIWERSKPGRQRPTPVAATVVKPDSARARRKSHVGFPCMATPRICHAPSILVRSNS